MFQMYSVNCYRTCGWNDTSVGSYKFVSSTGRSGGGPSIDHTKRTADGHYMMLADNRGASGYKLAELMSPTLRNAAADCTLRFW